MSYSNFTNYNGSYGLAYYNGYIYAGSYSDGKIIKIQFNDSSVQSDFYVGFSSNDLGFMRVSGNYLYCSLQTSGKIVRFNLGIDSPSPVDFITGLSSPKAFFIYDGYIYVTLSNAINSYSLSDGSFDMNLIDSSTTYSGTFVLDTPSGIDTNGSFMYFCNYGTNTNIYYCNLNGSGIGILSTLSQGTNDGLLVYGNNIFVSSNSVYKTYKINISSGLTTDFQTFTEKPNLLLSINNSLYISSLDSNKILTRPFSTSFNNQFTLSYSSNIFTYTLNNDFTVNNDWEEVGLINDKIILDGNSNTITITNLNTDTLFFGGNSLLSKRLEVKNFNIISISNILCGLLRSYGYTYVYNCHLQLTGNILNNGGGLVYNNLNNGTFGFNTVEMDLSSVLIDGKVGENAGPLLGYFSLGCEATISNSFSVIFDNNSDPITNTITLRSSAGSFVGSGVGSSGGVTINNSYTVFSGSLAYGSGIISGKFFGGNNNVTLNNFYAITNITYITTPTDPSNNAQYSYYISSYYGGSLFTSLNATNVNILDLGLTLSRMYANISTYSTTVPGVTTYTNYSSFEVNANSSSGRVGNETYYLNNINGSAINSYLMYSPTNNITYELLIGTNNKTLLDRTITFPTISEKTSQSDPFNLDVSVTPSTTIYYSSSNTNVATVNSSGEVTIKKGGNIQITAYTLCDETYTYVQSQQLLTIININRREPKNALQTLNRSFKFKSSWKGYKYYLKRSFKYGYARLDYNIYKFMYLNQKN